MKKYIFVVILLIMSISFSSFAQTYSDEKDQVNASVKNPDRISLMLSDVLVRRLSVEYEHVLSSGNMSITVPASVTLSPFEDIWSDQVHWWFGMGLKFYPTGQGTVRYFVGPEFRFISVTEYEYDWYYDSENNYFETNTNDKYIHAAFLINNGLIYSPTDEFFVSVSMGLGFLSRNPDTSKETLVPMATPSFRLGFKF